MPAFCEKPLATTLTRTLEATLAVERSGVPVQVGFQRRFDVGYRRAHEAVRSGELGFLHTVRANTHDQVPPAAEYLARSGGLIRDCSVHDFDIVRHVTGREFATARAMGANKGESFFAEAGDVDTAAALLTLDDDTIVIVTATRYNGGGHDVRLELMGSAATLGVGYDESLAVRSAEVGATYPAGPQKTTFMERFLPAYQAELAAFVELAAGRIESPCTVRDAVEAFRVAEACELARASGSTVQLSSIPGAP